MLQDDLQRSFASATSVPAELLALACYSESLAKSVFFSGQFEFCTDPQAALAWFDGDPEAARDFAVFGCEADGSLIAFWLYAGQPASRAPIVLLGSEGVGNKLLATDILDFLRLLSLGHPDFLFLEDQSVAPKPTADLLDFQLWLRINFAIFPPPDTCALLQRARAEHPDFQAWLDAWSARHLGSAA